MSGRDFKSILLIFKNQTGNFFRGTRIVVFILMMIILYVLVITPLEEGYHMMGGKLSFLEPFIAITNSRPVMLCIPLLFMILMVDYPQSGSRTFFLQVRCSKLDWIISQLVFGLFISLFTIIFILIYSIVVSLPMVEWSFEFSKTVTYYLHEFPEREGDLIVSLLPANIYNQMKVLEVVGNSIILMTTYLWIIYLVVLLATILNRRVIGMIVTLIIIVLGEAASILESKFMWLLPMPHSLSWIHFRDFISRPVFPLWLSYVVLLGTALLLAIMCIVFRKKYEAGKR